MNRQFELSEQDKNLIEKYLSSGAYTDANQIISKSLNMFDVEQQKLKALKEAIQEGIDSGVAQGFSFDNFRNEMAEKHSQK